MVLESENMVRLRENDKILYDSRESMYLDSEDFIVFTHKKFINDIIYEVLEKCVKINS